MNVKISRYSTDGFNPQLQTHHIKNVNKHLHDFDISLLSKTFTKIYFRKSN